MQLQPVQVALENSGLNAALRVLNNRVPHRFTAVYKVEDGAMRNVAIVDKQGEIVPADFLTVPLQHSFCQFVLKDGAFITANSALEEKLQGHIYRGVLNAYVGLPLDDTQGGLFGTFCHFDFPPTELPADEYEFLKQAVQLLPPYIIS